jgi:hypothetical protein
MHPSGGLRPSNASAGRSCFSGPVIGSPSLDLSPLAVLGHSTDLIVVPLSR